MKKLITLSALTTVLALAACSQEVSVEADTAGAEEEIVFDGEEPGFEAVAPGNYSVVHADGAADELTIHAGMTWSMVFADGEAAGGTIFAQGGQNCFVTEGVEEHQCFDASEIAEDGSMEVTDATGDTVTVTPTADS